MYAKQLRLLTTFVPRAKTTTGDKNREEELQYADEI